LLLTRKFFPKKAKFEKNSITIATKKLDILIYFMLLFLGGREEMVYAQKNEEVEKKAHVLYEKKMYCEALPLYSQLLSLDKTNPTYSFRFGVCLLFCDKRDVEKPVKFIGQARGKLPPSDSIYFNYYYGVACHQAFRFGEAIRAFTTFLNQKYVPFDLQQDARLRLQMCKNAIGLMRQLNELAVLQKFTSDYANFYRSYDLSHIGGSLGPKPDFLKTKYDKKHEKEPGLAYYYSKGNTLYYSSYGKDGAHGKDIYRVQRLPDGRWGKPELLSQVINTPLDEDYPVLAEDGKTLFFCSKGHNSMGGYDIFKSVYDSTKKEWSKPENLDFAINTPFDDLLFVPHPSMRYAWFASNRMSPNRKVNVFLVRIDKPLLQFTEFSPIVLTPDYLQVTSNEYLNTIQKIQQIASMEVNTNEKIYDETDTSKYALWQRYNIPPNPVDTQLVNRAFSYTREAEKSLFEFSQKRAYYNRLFVGKKNEAVLLNKQGEQLYEKALNEKDPEKQKQLTKQATDVLKLSNERLAESDVAKKMYEQYNEAYSFQEKKLDELLQEAGRVQQTALARKIHSSVTLLIRLIEKVEKFKIELVDAEKKIIGDPQFLVEKEKSLEKLSADIGLYQSKLRQIDDSIAKIESQLQSTTNPEKKSQLEKEKEKLLEKKNVSENSLRDAQKQLEITNNSLLQLRQEMAIRQKLHEEYAYASKNLSQDSLLASNIISQSNSQRDQLSDKNRDTSPKNLQPSEGVAISDGVNKKNTQNQQKPVSSDMNKSAANNKNTAQIPPKQGGQQTQQIAHSPISSQQANNKVKNEKNQQSKEQNLVANNVSASAIANDQSKKAQKNKQDSLEQSLKQLQNNFSKQVAFWKTLQQVTAEAYLTHKQAYDQAVINSSQVNVEQINQLGAEVQAAYDAFVVAKSYADYYKAKERDCQNLSEKLHRQLLVDTNQLKSVEKFLGEISASKEPEIHPSYITQKDSVARKLQQVHDELQPLFKRQNQLERQRDSLQTLAAKTRSKKKREKINNELNLLNISNEELKGEMEPLQAKKEILEKQLGFYENVDRAYKLINKELSTEIAHKQPRNVQINYEEIIPITAITNENERQALSQKILAASEQVPKGNVSTNTWKNWMSASVIGMSIKDVRSALQNEAQENLAQAVLYEQAGDAIMLKYTMLVNDSASNKNQENMSYLITLKNLALGYYQAAQAYRKEVEGKMDYNAMIQFENKLTQMPPQLIAQYHQEQYLKAIARRDSIQKLLLQTQDLNRRNELEKQLKEQDEIARRHFYLSQDVYGIWNNVQFEWKDAYANLPSQLRKDMIEARKLRSQAFQEKDFKKQQALFSEALTKEIAVLEATREIAPEDSVLQLMNTITSTVETNKKSSVQEVFRNYQQKQDDNALFVADLAKNVKRSFTRIETHEQSQQVERKNEEQFAQNNLPQNKPIVQKATENPISRKTLDLSSGNQPQLTSNTKPNVNSTSIEKTLHYRIQIAASKRKVDPSKYFNVSDVTIDSVNGWFCYMTEYFTCYNDARDELLQIRKGKYKDAFLVAYEEGKRISLLEARKKDNCVSQKVQEEMPRDFSSYTIPSISSVDGLVFSVQVGVFAMPRNLSKLYGLDFLLYDRLENGYYRYFSGIYTDLHEAIRYRDKIRKLIPDAFVVAIYQGKKISLAAALELQNKGVLPTTSFKFPDSVSSSKTTKEVGPVEYRIQIGAYRNEVPKSVVDKMLEVSTNMQVNKILQGDITCYTVGRFDSYDAAQKYLTEKVKSSFPDAFIIKIINGKKVQ